MKRFTTLSMALLLLLSMIGCTKAPAAPDEPTPSPSPAASDVVIIPSAQSPVEEDVDTSVHVTEIDVPASEEPDQSDEPPLTMVLTTIDDGHTAEYLLPPADTDTLLEMFYRDEMQVLESPVESPAWYLFCYGEDSFYLDGSAPRVFASIDGQNYMFDLSDADFETLNAIVDAICPPGSE